MPPKPSCECGECLTCRKRLSVKKFRERHPERWQQIQLQSQERNREKIRARSRERYHGDPSIRERNTARRKREPEKGRARWNTWKAVRDGVLVKGPCEVGGDCLGPIEAHHDDYSKPLEVRWMCKRHHMRLHRSGEAWTDRGMR